MQATLTLTGTPPASKGDLGVTHQATAQQAVCLHSDALLQGKKSVAIVHNGAIYRLQATKLGKLILTK